MKAAHKTAGQKNARHQKVREPGSDVAGKSGLGLLVDELRAQALNLKRGHLPLTGSLYGLVIETALTDRVTSLVVLSDGSTSWYVSTGHGCMGCGDDAEVNHAAKQLIAYANELIADAQLTDDSDPPTQGATRLFLLADDGMRLIDTQSTRVTNAMTSDALVTLLLKAQRLLQLIEQRGAGVSLEQQLADEAAKLDASDLNESINSENRECLSAGNVANRSHP